MIVLEEIDQRGAFGQGVRHLGRCDPVLFLLLAECLTLPSQLALEILFLVTEVVELPQPGFALSRRGDLKGQVTRYLATVSTTRRD